MGLKIAAPYLFTGHLAEVTAAGVEESTLSVLPADRDGFEFGALTVKDVNNPEVYAAFLAVIRLPAADFSSAEFLDSLATQIAKAGPSTWRVETVNGSDLRIISGPGGYAEIVFTVGDRLVWVFAAPEESQIGVAKAIVAANS